MRGRALLRTLVVALLLAAPTPSSGQDATSGRRVAATLPDLSGLAWLSDDVFVGVHDAKNPKENDRPRVSLLWLPASPEGITWRPVELAWPEPLGPSSDLESAARIPGTRSLLLVESGEGKAAGEPARRIFLAERVDQDLRIAATAEWPASVKNVEGTAVARVGNRLIFIYAERAQGQPSTNIRWAPLELQPLGFGAFQEVTFPSPDPPGPDARPVSAIEVDDAGRLYAASAFDPGDDNGPFRSAVWRIGRVEAGDDRGPRVVLDAQPQRLATLDGLKVESLAARQGSGSDTLLYVGTDDENYGGTLRPLPPRP
ncbi:MAG TPA: hypothetical protein VHK28_10875 [Candidatus Limnocylindria bacterium]|nr:hypothetical protein [Candidatus Limnocylindria bacterium]